MATKEKKVPVVKPEPVPEPPKAVLPVVKPVKKTVPTKVSVVPTVVTKAIVEVIPATLKKVEKKLTVVKKTAEVVPPVVPAPVPVTTPKVVKPKVVKHREKPSAAPTEANPFPPHITIFTDGSCKGTMGGYAALLTHGGDACVIRGNETNTTNNRMELQAVISAAETLTEPCQIKVVSDSQYVVKATNEWIDGWKKRRWKTSAGKDVENADLMKQLDAQRQKHSIEAFWVRSHQKNSKDHNSIQNAFCDEQAQRMTDRLIAMSKTNPF